MRHKLKTDNASLADIRSGAKSFDIRRDDRGFEVGHILWLKGWDADTNQYTGEELKVDVIYILRDTLSSGLVDGFCLMGIKVREKPAEPIRGPYVEDLTCLDDYPGLKINGVRLSGDHCLPYRTMTIQWSGNCGWGELELGLDKDGAAHCDTEYMSGDFVRALLTLFFLEANPQWDPRPKKTTDNGEDMEPRNLADLAHSYSYYDTRIHINEHVNRKIQKNG